MKLFYFLRLGLIIAFFSSCEKCIEGVCETAAVSSSGKAIYFAFTSEPAECNGLNSNQHYHLSESTGSLGYSEKGDPGIPEEQITWNKNKVYFINPAGVDKPGAKGYFLNSDDVKNNASFGSWERIDGGSYMRLGSSTVELCNATSGAKFTGTYNPASNIATLISGSTTATFYVYIEDEETIRVEQFISGNHVPSQLYYRIAEYPC